MGRKVHPYGFRLGYIYDWKARWYAEDEEYADLLGEDLKVRELIRNEVGHAGISKVEIERFPRARQLSATRSIAIASAASRIEKPRRSARSCTV